MLSLSSRLVSSTSFLPSFLYLDSIRQLHIRRSRLPVWEFETSALDLLMCHCVIWHRKRWLTTSSTSKFILNSFTISSTAVASFSIHIARLHCTLTKTFWGFCVFALWMFCSFCFALLPRCGLSSKPNFVCQESYMVLTSMSSLLLCDHKEWFRIEISRFCI